LLNKKRIKNIDEIKTIKNIYEAITRKLQKKKKNRKLLKKRDLTAGKTHELNQNTKLKII